MLRELCGIKGGRCMWRRLRCEGFVRISLSYHMSMATTGGIHLASPKLHSRYDNIVHINKTQPARKSVNTSIRGPQRSHNSSDILRDLPPQAPPSSAHHPSIHPCCHTYILR